MKGIVILSVLLFAGAVLGAPTEARWQMVPDGDGHMHLIDTLAEDVESFWNPAVDVFFVLHTRRNPTAGQRLARTTASLQGSQWNSASAGTRFIIHGWNNNHQSPVNVQITSAFLAAADHNVVRVDWGVGANNPNYLTSRNRVPDAASQVASFIDWLHLNGFLVNFNRLVIAGHSLGAHIAGKFN